MQSLILKLQAEVEARKQHPAGTFPRPPEWRSWAELLFWAPSFWACSRRSRRWCSGREALGVAAPEGAIELQQVEIDRLKRIHENSAKFGIPADLAERIEDIALAEGIEPHVAFGLVRAESEFNRRAVSPVGAVGLTQLMPSHGAVLQARA